MKTRKISIVAQVILTIAAILLVSDLVLGLVVAKTTNTTMLSSVQENVLEIAKYAAASVDPSEMQDVLDKGADSEYWDKIYDALSFYLMNTQIEYIYTVYQKDGELFYAIDTDPEAPADFGEKLEDDEDAFLAASGTASVNDTPYTDEWGRHLTAWYPIKNGNEVVAIVGVDVSAASVIGSIQAVVLPLAGVFVVAFLITMVIVLIAGRKLSSGFFRINHEVEDLTNGSKDLTKNVIENNGNEFEVIAGNVNKFINEVHELVALVNESSNDINSSTESMNNDILVSSENAQNISAVTEEICASMEQVSEAINKLSRSTDEMLKSIEEIMGDVTTGNNLVKDIQTRADGIKKDTEKKEAGIKASVSQSEEKMKESIEASKNVSTITQLTNDILSIASQTNLLALNASIEAARAGDAGRGFAVVAEEIRVLADGSRETASNIQTISKEVIDAVDGLVESSNAILSLLNESIMPDYESFTGIADNYSDDADKIQEIINNLSANIRIIRDNVASLATESESIATIATDCETGINDAAQNTTNLANQLSDIDSESAKVRAASEKLLTVVSEYKI